MVHCCVYAVNESLLHSCIHSNARYIFRSTASDLHPYISVKY